MAKKMSLGMKLFALFIILLMSSWAIAAYFNTSKEKGRKPDFELANRAFYILDDGSFVTFVDIGGKETPIAFRLDPRQATNISLNSTVVPEILQAQKVYITLNPNQIEPAKFAVAAAEISRITSLYGIKTIGAYTEDSNPPNPNVPLRTCENATETTKVIVLELGNKTSISNDAGCIYVQGQNGDELILAADKLGYNLLGIKV